MFDAYWSPINNKLRKREGQLQALKMQFHAFKLNSYAPSLESEEDLAKKKAILHRFTKANMKLNIPLDLEQMVSLFRHFIACTQEQITVSFKDWKGLKTLIEEFSSSGIKASSNGQSFDIQGFVEVKLKHRNTF